MQIQFHQGVVSTKYPTSIPKHRDDVQKLLLEKAECEVTWTKRGTNQPTKRRLTTHKPTIDALIASGQLKDFNWDMRRRNPEQVPAVDLDKVSKGEKDAWRSFMIPDVTCFEVLKEL